MTAMLNRTPGRILARGNTVVLPPLQATPLSAAGVQIAANDDDLDAARNANKGLMSQVNHCEA